jgi:hypothetical protein
MRKAWLVMLMIPSAGCDTTEPSERSAESYNLLLSSEAGMLYAVAGTAAPAALTVRLSAEPRGTYPIAGQVVHFSLTAADDHLSADSVVTDASGLATVMWMPGTTAGDRFVDVVTSVQGTVARLAVLARVSPGPIVRGDLAPMFTGPSTNRQLKTVDTVHVGQPYSDRDIYTAFYDAYGNPVLDVRGRVIGAALAHSAEGSEIGQDPGWPVYPPELGPVNLFIWVDRDRVAGVARQLFVIPNPTGSRLLDSDIAGTWHLALSTADDGTCGMYPVRLPLIAGGVELTDGSLQYSARINTSYGGSPDEGPVTIDPRTGTAHMPVSGGMVTGTMLSDGTLTGTYRKGTCAEQVSGGKIAADFPFLDFYLVGYPYTGGGGFGTGGGLW